MNDGVPVASSIHLHSAFDPHAFCHHSTVEILFKIFDININTDLIGKLVQAHREAFVRVVVVGRHHRKPFFEEIPSNPVLVLGFKQHLVVVL